MKICVVILLFTCLACVHGLTPKEEWANFKDLFNRSFDVEEDRTRYEIFKRNLALVKEQNAKFKRGEATHGAAINDLSDRSEDERRKLEERLRPVPASGRQ